MRVLAVFSLTLLAACATPQERCVSQAMKPYTDALEEQRELEQVLARGYALRQVQVPYQRFVLCDPQAETRRFCWRNVWRLEMRLQEVDLGEIRRRVADISARLPALRRDANAGAAQCRAAPPA